MGEHDQLDERAEGWDMAGEAGVADGDEGQVWELGDGVGYPASEVWEISECEDDEAGKVADLGRDGADDVVDGAVVGA